MGRAAAWPTGPKPHVQRVVPQTSGTDRRFSRPPASPVGLTKGSPLGGVSFEPRSGSSGSDSRDPKCRGISARCLFPTLSRELDEPLPDSLLYGLATRADSKLRQYRRDMMLDRFQR